MKTFLAELHIHTVLSPCASVEMIPPLIVRTALDMGINLIAITDHNSGKNAAAVIKAAQSKELTVLPGMELQTREDVHVLCLFDTLEQLDSLQILVDQSLPNIKNNIEFYGEQFIVDHTGEFIQRESQLLLTSTNLSFEDAFKAVNGLGGLFIPAHVTRQAFGLITHLGFVPPDVPIEALEISRHIDIQKINESFPQIKDFPIIQSGDVHYLDDFLSVNQFKMKKPSILEIKLALQNTKDRHFEVIHHN